jgi:uncharacterized protein YndB with AHSA1/START domain
MAETKETITITTEVKLPSARVWELWTNPKHITKWNNASPDWHSPNAENDVRPGGKFSVRMEAKDGSQGFEFGGTYDRVTPNQSLWYTLGDGRKVKVAFEESKNATRVTETFEPEGSNPVEFQRDGWQAILENFRKYAESQSN